MKKMIEQRKREKEEEKMARQRVREQIEKDKKDRAAKVQTYCTISIDKHILTMCFNFN